jgi:flagellar biosynthetic protein FliR
LTVDLSPLFAFVQSGLVVGVYVFLRVGAAMAVLPAFGERSIPARVRLAASFSFTIIVVPAAAPQITTQSLNEIVLGFHLFTEVAVGLLIGIGLRLFILALQTAGAIAAQSTSLSQIFGAAGVDPQPAIGHLMVIAGLALAVSLHLHVRIAELFVGSYEIFPPGTGFKGIALYEWGTARVSAAFALAFSIAAPFVIASFIYNVALGVINKAMPQLMVAFVGAPAITAGGLLLLFATMPFLLTVWSQALLRYMNSPFGLGP